jgi:hypothetical protein
MSGKGKGKAKAGDSAVKTRNISSFFRPAAPAAAPPPPCDDADAEEPQEAPSPKRQRVAPPSDADAGGGEASGAGGADDEDMPAARALSPPRAPRVPRAAPLPAEFPASDAARHAHFADKLSLGPPRKNGAQRDSLVAAPPSAYGRDAGPGGPYTPLEKQIVALKRAHPGVLLMVEARKRREAQTLPT